MNVDYSRVASFDNRIAVVTGAAGNIGSCVVRRLVAQGVKCAAVDFRAEDVEARLRDRGVDPSMYHAYAVDQADREAVFAFAERVVTDFGKVDILINNAAVWIHRNAPGKQRFETIPYEEWKRVLTVDVDGVFNFCQAFIPHMMERHYGRIVNTTSIAGEVGLPGHADYAAAKAAILKFSETLAMENARYGITVNCMSPGMVASGDPQPCRGTWVGREGSGDENARAIVFLAADESGFITGADLPVEGGRKLGPFECVVV